MLYELNENEEVRHLSAFVDSLTSIGMVKDDLEEVSKLYNVCYHWVKVISKMMPEKTYINYRPTKGTKPASKSAIADVGTGGVIAGGAEEAVSLCVKVFEGNCSSANFISSFAGVHTVT